MYHGKALSAWHAKGRLADDGRGESIYRAADMVCLLTPILGAARRTIICCATMFNGTWTCFVNGCPIVVGISRRAFELHEASSVKLRGLAQLGSAVHSSRRGISEKRLQIARRGFKCCGAPR